MQIPLFLPQNPLVPVLKGKFIMVCIDISTVVLVP